MSDNDQLAGSQLRLDLQSKNAATRREALLALAGVKRDRKLLAVFKEVAERDADPAIRAFARKLYQETKERIGDDLAREVTIQDEAGRIEPGTLATVLGGTDAVSKLEALRQVTLTRDRTAVAVIRKALGTESDAWVVASLLKALGAVGTAEDIHVLQPYLKSNDLRIQANAIEALEMIGDELAFSLVSPMLQSADARIRANAVRCLSRLDPGEAFEAVARLARSDQPVTRKAGLACLALLQHPKIGQLVGEMASREGEADLLKREIELLGQEGSPTSLGALKWLARNRTDEAGLAAAKQLTDCLAQNPMSDAEVSRLEGAFAATLGGGTRRGDVAMGSGAGGGSSPAAADPLARSRPPSPLVAAGEGFQPLSAERTQRELYQELAKTPRRRAGDGSAQAPPPPLMFDTVRENPGFLAMLGFTAIFLVWGGYTIVTGVGTSDPAGGPTKSPVKIVRETRPTTAPTARPTVSSEDAESLTCTVDHYDPAQKTALLKNGDQLIMAKFPKLPDDEIKKGDSVRVRGRFTGKVRFGARYFEAETIEKD